jgi:hypothetical protein
VRVEDWSNMVFAASLAALAGAGSALRAGHPPLASAVFGLAAALLVASLWITDRSRHAVYLTAWALAFLSFVLWARPPNVVWAGAFVLASLSLLVAATVVAWPLRGFAIRLIAPGLLLIVVLVLGLIVLLVLSITYGET